MKRPTIEKIDLPHDPNKMCFHDIPKYLFYLLLKKNKYHFMDEVKIEDQCGRKRYEIEILKNDEKIIVNCISGLIFNRIEFSRENSINPIIIISAGYTKTENETAIPLNQINGNDYPLLRIDGKNFITEKITKKSFDDLPQSPILKLVKSLILPLSKWIENKKMLSSQPVKIH